MSHARDFEHVYQRRQSTIQVVIADDHPVVRRGLENVLCAHQGIEITGSFGNGLSALAAVVHTTPDLLFLDISMPVMDGLTTLSLINQRKLPTRVITWTGYEEARLVRDMLGRGAAGYLFKHSSSKMIFEAMACVLDGQRYIPPEAERLLRVAHARQSQEGLSQREREVLCLIADGLSTQEIAERLKLSIRTIDGHRRNIGRRLGIHNVALLTRYAIAEGLVPLE